MRHLAILFLFLYLPLSAQIVNIEELRIRGTNDSTRWYGALKGACQLSKVKEQSLLVHGESQVQYKHDRSIWLLLLNTNFVRAGNRDFVNATFGHLRYNYKIKTPLSWEVYVQQQTNKLLLIQNRSLAGTGLRQRLFINKVQNSRLYLGTAYLYERNQYTDDFGRKYWHRISNYMSVTLHNKKTGALVQATTYWQPVIGFIKKSRISTEWTLELPMGKHLRFSSDFAWSTDRSLPEGAPLQVYTWQNGVVWRL
jgi:hypothetical protein